MKLTVGKQCVLTGVPPQIRDQLKTALTMANPAHQDARRHNRWTGKIPKILRFYEEAKDGSLSFPRGFLRQALDITGRNICFEDRRRTLPEIDLRFTGELRPYQDEAVRAILVKDFGVLSALTGSGKTVIALAVMAQRKQPTLILCHTKELLVQWADRIRSFLHIESGLIGDGKFNVRPITVGIINSVRKHLDILPAQFGQIVGDETHRIPIKTYSDIVRAFDCRYMLALSATPYRRDGLTKLIHWYVGLLVHQVDPSELQNLGAVLIPEIIHKQTDFYYNFRDDYTKMLSVLTQDETRNAQIAQDILWEAGNHRGTILVVSDRIKHCLALADLLLGNGLDLNVKILTGQLKSKERISLVEDIRAGKVKVVIATVQLISEGFDCPGLSSLFLATPIKFEGRVVQTVGRILRPMDGKTPRVYDYQDPCSVLYASSKARMRTYKKMNWLK